jgi:aryl-alcohol dehydrogenase-like predicted oxidoreductase
LRERTHGSDIAWVGEGFLRSLERLRRDSVDGLLVHHAADLIGPSGDRIYSELNRLKTEGRVRQIGLSAYTGAEVDIILDRYDIDLIQIPLNVFDQRLVLNGQLQRLRECGVEIHARSVFLQGLLLMDPETTPPNFLPIRPLLQAWRDAISKLEMTAVEGAFAFIKSLNIDVAIVGVDSAKHLRSNQQEFFRSPSHEFFDQFGVKKSIQ